MAKQLKHSALRIILWSAITIYVGFTTVLAAHEVDDRLKDYYVNSYMGDVEDMLPEHLKG